MRAAAHGETASSRRFVPGTRHEAPRAFRLRRLQRDCVVSLPATPSRAARAPRQ